ncbi:MAG: hypothetical protein EA365_07425 [Gloeocapsa sp. DLM2.Bin57]|nr:MAG: hypothetical protein EA365_07425 [Gloeocapsa sp. DLM2.Bin57]
MFKTVIQAMIILLGINLMTIPSHSQPICTEDINQLTKQLLEDLPNYTNRVIRSGQPLDISNLQIRHIIAVSQPEFQPLPLPQLQYTRVFDDSPTQIFFTTLERIYVQNRGVETQGFHWLFLVETQQGWDFFFLLSANQTDQLLTPPRESNQSAIASAIRLWLRDYQSSCL